MFWWHKTTLLVLNGVCHHRCKRWRTCFMHCSAANKPAAAAKQKLAVLDLKRATAVGIRMSRLR